MLKRRQLEFFTIIFATLMLLPTNLLAQEYLKTSHLYPQTTQADWIVSYSESYRENSAPYDLYEKITAFGDDETAIVNRMGSPKERFEWKVENRHEPEYMNTVVTLVYDGLVIELLESKYKTFVKRVYLSSCEINSVFQNYMCKPIATVINQLGKPTVRQNDELIYTLQHGDVGANPMRLGIANGEISWIYLRNYID
ncbi:hypothetical protein CWI84_00430 [Idiomarina tyrosinivorans]|uniref:Uncharacterized protein n=1 Tax=Idiomarina tyrosinivorans TaxID=1445662 RepID=A0A432ZTU3_9GAMM|nr:hypothetical protein [Idiomarina tyrosinivorans]RUO81262.1 hypothetical protein CWI84_00430 [Idiomarina tyrosinivorans]